MKSWNQVVAWIRSLQYRQVQSIKVGINWIEILIVWPNCSCRISTQQKKSQGNMCSAASPRWLSLSRTLLWSLPKVCRDSPNSTKRTKLYCSRSVYRLPGQCHFISSKVSLPGQGHKAIKDGFYRYKQ